jgi:wyosine [tRNA(Phe)-imidazoG37] synthetase (radical SAM superfamily)
MKKNNYPWTDFQHIYPVVSRRSRGISIGVNLSPEKFCNFNCVYCQIPREEKGNIVDIHVNQLLTELREMLEIHRTGELFKFRPFSSLPFYKRDIHDIAFAGNGEPTLAPQFPEIIEKIRSLRDEQLGKETKLVLITNSSQLSNDRVRRGLEFLDHDHDEIWAKLDAGTSEYFKRVDRTTFSLDEVTEQIKTVAHDFPVVLQSMFMRVRDSAPDWREIVKYCERVASILASEGRIKLIQIYTVARKPAEDWVNPLTDQELKRISYVVQQSTGIRSQVFA